MFMFDSEPISDFGLVVRLLCIESAATLPPFLPAHDVSAMSKIFVDAPPLYAENPDWADVTPQAQYENVNPLAPIFYTEECS